MKRHLLTSCMACFCAVIAFAQTQEPSTITIADVVESDTVLFDPVTGTDTIPPIIYESMVDSLLANVKEPSVLYNTTSLPRVFFLPAIYNTYIVDTDTLTFAPGASSDPALLWIEREKSLDNQINQMWQRIAIADAKALPYNIVMLPEAPKHYDVVINPEDYTVNIVEQITTPATEVEKTVNADEIEKKHWIKTFTGNLQFSQAYVSPNWYQGGNNNLNMLLNLNYNIKLNQKFHPNLLFETNMQYKLGLYSTPDDSLRSYNISEDLLQINSTFGVKAAKKWYYTINAQFKTQLFDSYATNTNNLRAALLSPGELNVGLGMTYNTSNEKKTFTFDVSISPLSYNMMMCTDTRMDETAFGIDPGKHFVSKYGSSIECKLGLKLTSNISLASRLFAFTDYSRAYADLENTMVFEINKYLTTQIFVHMRYDTNTPYVDPSWHKLQIKEILSMGFTYKFSTI